jgi:hypothetical protein
MGGDRVQALLASVDTPLGKLRPCDIHKLVYSLKLREACGVDGIPNECFRHLPRRPLVHLTHLFNHCLQLSHFPKHWKEAKLCYRNLARTQNSIKILVRLASCPQQASYSEVILQIVQRHTEERSLLNESQFGFRASHSTTLQ